MKRSYAAPLVQRSGTATTRDYLVPPSSRAGFRQPAARLRRTVSSLSERDFDFWVGDWDVSWGDGKHGTNVISHLFDGCAILEQFDGRPGVDLRGASVSIYDGESARWRQTWVDSERNYMPFEGAFADGVMDLRTTRDRVVYRMLWRDIQPETLHWLWQCAANDAWETLWELHYVRRP
jgi:hypothetical protein